MRKSIFSLNNRQKGPHRRVTVRVVEARDILNRDVVSGSDAFVSLRCGMDSFTTKTVMDSQSPAWDEEFSFRSFGEETTRLRLAIWTAATEWDVDRPI